MINIKFPHTDGRKVGNLNYTIITNVVSFRKEDDFVEKENNVVKRTHVAAIACIQQSGKHRFIRFPSIRQRDQAFQELKLARELYEVPFKLMLPISSNQLDSTSHISTDLYWQLSVMNLVDIYDVDCFKPFRSPELIISDSRLAVSLLKGGEEFSKQSIAEIWALTMPVPNKYIIAGISPVDYFKFKLG